MEQRKVLLIVISISIVLAATIGVGLLLYYPREEQSERVEQTEFWDPMDFLQGSGTRPGLADGTAQDDGDEPGAVAGTGDDATDTPDDDPFAVTYGIREDGALDDGPTLSTELQQTGFEVVEQPAPGETDPPSRERAVEPETQADPSVSAQRTTPAEPTRRAPTPSRNMTQERAPVITQEQTLASRAYWVQVISSPNRDTVEQAQRELAERLVSTRILTKEIGETIYYRLRLGPFAVREEAEKFLDWIIDLERFADALIFVDYTTSVRAPSG